MVTIILPNHNETKLRLVQEAVSLLPINCQVVIATDTDGEGKGAAIREGLKVAGGDQIILLDADLDIHPRMILRLIPYLQDYDIVVGTKDLSRMPNNRKLVTFLSRIYIRLLFGIRVDTQTGLKLFRREALTDWETQGYAYDIEVLAKAARAGKTMIEVPIDAYITKRMPFKAIWKTFIESVKIWYQLSSRVKK